METIYYQQNEGTASYGYPLSPIVANIFKEFFKEIASYRISKIETILLDQICDVDDTFTLWPNEEATLGNFP